MVCLDGSQCLGPSQKGIHFSLAQGFGLFLRLTQALCTMLQPLRDILLVRTPFSK